MQNKQIVEILRIANREALETRRMKNIERSAPLNPFELAASMGASIRFKDAKTLEGMFAREPAPTIFLPCTKHRPFGRICFSCAHELGHLQLGHVVSVDKVGEVIDRDNLKERAADSFAGWLLMPRQAVTSAFERRKCQPSITAPEILMTISNELNVSLDALAYHMSISLKLTDNDWLEKCLRIQPKKIIERIIGEEYRRRTVFVDSVWKSEILDVEVDDRIVIDDLGFHPTDEDWFVRLNAVREHNRTRVVLAPRCVGTWVIRNYDFEIRVRVAPRNFCGLYRYRFLQQEED